jgi:LDH2 family malate/lactate/ureidoglycolate dehydrogenase
MSSEVCWVPFDVLQSFMVDLFCAIGVPKADAQICADVLITADKRGIDSHGVGRLKTIYYDRIVKHGIQQAVTEFEVVRDRAATAVVDGHHGMGMVISKRAMQMAMDKARQYGLGMVAVRNSTHYGFAAYYPIMASDAGMIGLTGTNARPSTAPTFGVENMMGTNPLVFAMPSDEPFPFTNDYATSIIQRGRIEKYVREGKDCPPGLIVDREGNTQTDSRKILDALISGDAALLPIGGMHEETGGHKGYGFAAVVELLSSALQQGAFLKALSGFDSTGSRIPYSLGHFFLAIDIEHFTELEAFKKTTGDILRTLRGSQKAPGCERIYTHGEKEYLSQQERCDKGAPINAELQHQLTAMRDEQGLTQYCFPFEN